MIDRRREGGRGGGRRICRALLDHELLSCDKAHLQLSCRDELLDLRLLGRALLRPPALKECLFDLNKFAVRILEQGLHRSRNDAVHIRRLNRVVSSERVEEGSFK